MSETTETGEASLVPDRAPHPWSLKSLSIKSMAEWVMTTIGILTSGTAIWSAFTVVGATAENARARLFEHQLDACLSISETGTAFADSLSDAKALIDVRAMMGTPTERLQQVFADQQKTRDAAIKEADKAFSRNIRELQILYPKAIGDDAIRLSAHGTAASAMVTVAWATGDAQAIAHLTDRVDQVRTEVGALSQTCAASLAGTARLTRE